MNSQTSDRAVLLAVFILKPMLDQFLTYISEKHGINKEKVFVFETNTDPDKNLLTFKFIIREGKRVEFNKLFPGAIPIHKKQRTFYTINALNKLIEETSELPAGNLDHKSIIIDWTKHENKFFLIREDKLVAMDIKLKI